LFLQSPHLHCSIADTFGYKDIEALSKISNRTDASAAYLTAMGSKMGNPAVYGYKFIVFLLLYIYALNSASDQCT